MKKWYSLIVIIVLMGVITIIGLIFGQEESSIGTLREDFVGKSKDELIARFGLPIQTRTTPHKAAPSLVYDNLTQEEHGGRTVFDFNEHGRIVAVYMDQTHLSK